MWKMVLAGTTALAIGGGTLAYAQQGPGGPGPRGPHWRPSAEDIGAFADARIAALHAGLKLTAEQEKNWPAFESAARDMAKQRQERFAARANAERPTNPVERLNLMAEAMQARGAALKKVADAAGPRASCGRTAVWVSTAALAAVVPTGAVPGGTTAVRTAPAGLAVRAKARRGYNRLP
jgi:hypothetical protein